MNPAWIIAGILIGLIAVVGLVMLITYFQDNFYEDAPYDKN